MDDAAYATGWDAAMAEVSWQLEQLRTDLAAAQQREREAKRMAVFLYEKRDHLWANDVHDTIEQWRKELKI